MIWANATELRVVCGVAKNVKFAIGSSVSQSRSSCPPIEACADDNKIDYLLLNFERGSVRLV